MSTTSGYAAHSSTAPLEPFPFDRREPLATDVEIDIQYCGVCHSDLHTARSEWPGTVYPVIPGHEIVGRVSRVGGAVQGFAAGFRPDGVRPAPNAIGTRAAHPMARQIRPMGVGSAMGRPGLLCGSAACDIDPPAIQRGTRGV